MATPSEPTAAREIGPYVAAVIAGALLGLPLGVVTGNWPNVEQLPFLWFFFPPRELPLAITGIVIGVVFVLGRAMMRARSAAMAARTAFARPPSQDGHQPARTNDTLPPLVAVLALIGGFCLGFVVAPGPIESDGPGTGTARMSADPTVLWSGPVECRWRSDGDGSTRYVEFVDGFGVPITDPKTWRTSPPKDGDPRVTTVYLDGTVYYHGLTRAWAKVKAVSAGKTGTAVLNYPRGLVLSWTCE